jgi:hypothetical protein
MALQTQSYASYFEATFPLESDVRVGVAFTDGVTVFNGSADPDHPAETDVRAGVQYNNTINTGSMVIPAETDVRLGTAYDVAPNAKTGNVREALESQVQLNVVYGANDTLTGEYSPPVGGYPSEVDVRDGSIYGALNEFTGQLDLPSVDDVRLTVMFDSSSKTGTVRVPPADKVEDGYAYDANDSLTGTLTVGGGYPDATDVRDAVVYGAASEFTGSLDLPNINKVRAGVVFDGGTKMGNSVQPPENKVEDGTGYGSLGTEFTGALDIGGNITVPNPSDVRFGTIYGTSNNTTGVLQLPQEAQVLLGVGYGANGIEYEGQLTEVPGGSVTPMPPVTIGGEIRSPLIIGDSYTDPTNPFIWQIPAPAGMTAVGSTATFSGGMCCTDQQWSSTGTIAEADGVWTLTFEMTAAETAAIEAGDHEWSVRLTEGTAAFTAARGEVEWVCR